MISTDENYEDKLDIILKNVNEDYDKKEIKQEKKKKQIQQKKI